MVRWLLLGWLVLGLLALPSVAADPGEESCETHLVVDDCEGTRTESSASCHEPSTPPGHHVIVCSEDEQEEEYRRVEVLGLGVELVEQRSTHNGTFEASDSCRDESGQVEVVSRGHAVRTISPAGGVWLGSSSYDATVQEQGDSACPRSEGSWTEEESGAGQDVTFGSDVGPQPIDVELRVERSEARHQYEHVADGRNSSTDISGLLVSAKVNGMGVSPVIGVYHKDDGAGCESRGVVVLLPAVASRSFDSGCLPQ